MADHMSEVKEKVEPKKIAINWKVRIRNKTFWMTEVPAIILAVQLFANIFGIKLDLGDLGNRIVAFVDAAFVVLAAAGIAIDPTTYGVSDSGQAMGYDFPRKG